MTKLLKPFKSTELKEDRQRVFENGDAQACKKTLTDPVVARMALEAAFEDRPTYFVSRDPKNQG